MICNFCGCSDLFACEDPITGAACSWAAPDLCSVCARGVPGPEALEADAADLAAAGYTDLSMPDGPSPAPPLLFDQYGRPLL